jgi:predicted PurR-regulated permease PerM
MIITSDDILNVVLAICALIVTGFLAWILYYIANIARQANEVLTQTRQAVDDTFNTIEALKQKLSVSTSHLRTVAGGIRSVLEFFRKESQPKPEKKSKKKS